MTTFRWVLMCLTAFRLTRLITSDDLTEFLREKVYFKFGDDSNMATLVSCGWCASLYTTVPLFVIDHYFPIPFVVLATVAAMSVVGYLSTYDRS